MKNDTTFSLPSLVGIGMGETILEETPADNVITLEKRRTSVDLSARTLKELDWLAGGPETKKRAEALRESLYLFWMLAGMEERRIEVFIQDEDGGNSLFVPTLNAINGLLRSSGRTDGIRFTLELPARTLREIDELRKYTGESKLADVIRQAIHLNWTLFNEVQKGRKVIVREPSGEKYDLFVADADEVDHPEPSTVSLFGRRR